jgi:hypothetical protein
VPVEVTSVGGTSAAAPAARFDYHAVPRLTSVTPDRGPLVGGGTIVIAGTGLRDATAVSIGGVPAPFTQVSPTEVDAVVPATATPGAAAVVVTTPGGPSAGDRTYTYHAVPEVRGAMPSEVGLAGGRVLIAGIGLTAASAVTFGGMPATEFHVVSDDEISAVAPARSSGGQVEIAVTTPGGTGICPAHAFRYIGPPVVTQLTPSSGPVLGGNHVVIAGTDLDVALTVTLVSHDPLSADVTVPFTPRPDGSLDVVMPRHLPGSVAVRVANPFGTSPDTPAATYVYALVQGVL